MVGVGVDTHGIDALRAVVVGGSGVVARFPGVVCVARGGDTAAVRTLLDLCLAAAGEAPGRPLGHSLARWLAGPDAPDDLVFGTVAAADADVAVFLHGPVTAGLTERGRATTLSGDDAVAWLDRLVHHPGERVLLSLDPAEVPVDADLAARPHDLRAGVVPGAAVVLVPEGAGVPADAPAAGLAANLVAAAPAEPAVPDSGPSPVVPPPAAQAVPLPTPRAPRRHERIDGFRDGPRAGSPADDGGARAPLADGVPVGGPTVPAGGRGRGGPGTDPGSDDVTEQSRDPLARGFVCSRGHLNDPRSHFCVLCGIRMNERTGVLTTGLRPPLGLLVFDDGTTWSVDAEYVVGRTPEADERVRSGELRALMVDDRGDTVSRVHAEVRIRDWDVLLVDAGSRNGTYVVPPAGLAWERVPEGRSLRLEPGTRVRLGHHRTFLFESPSGVR